MRTGTFAGQEKSVTAGTSATPVTPDSGKYLSKVTVNPTPATAKTITPTNRNQQVVNPDSGKYLSSVTVNLGSVPNTNSSTYTSPAGWNGVPVTGGNGDIGASNTHRFVNAENVYSAGRSQGRSDIGSDGYIEVSLNGEKQGGYDGVRCKVYAGVELGPTPLIFEAWCACDEDDLGQIWVKTNYYGIQGKV